MHGCRMAGPELLLITDPDITLWNNPAVQENWNLWLLHRLHFIPVQA